MFHAFTQFLPLPLPIHHTNRMLPLGFPLAIRKSTTLLEKSENYNSIC
jgi:hypothetical protein